MTDPGPGPGRDPVQNVYWIPGLGPGSRARVPGSGPDPGRVTGDNQGDDTQGEMQIELHIEFKSDEDAERCAILAKM